jgi:3-oxoacyl-[acyl-carrier protein] reductase
LKRVVFVLSSASFCRGTGPYARAKGAELALCRLLANELAPRGVRVDAMVPGWTDTPMAREAAAARGCDLAAIAKEHPQGRILQADEVGRLCASLLFEHSEGPPGSLIVWDLRDGPNPVRYPLGPHARAN